MQKLNDIITKVAGFLCVVMFYFIMDGIKEMKQDNKDTKAWVQALLDKSNETHAAFDKRITILEIEKGVAKTTSLPISPKEIPKKPLITSIVLSLPEKEYRISQKKVLYLN